MFRLEKQNNGRIRMHRAAIMNALNGLYVDHRNHCCIDNRKSNLRICNHINELPRKDGTSKYKGIRTQSIDD